jgi:hypothetical protein
MNTIFKQNNVIVWLKRGVVSLLILIIALPIVGAVYQFAATTIDRNNFPSPGQMVDMGGYKLLWWLLNSSVSSFKSKICHCPL